MPCSNAEQGEKYLCSIDATHGIQSSASDVSTEPFLVAHTPTPGWVEKSPFVSQRCSLIFLSSLSLLKACRSLPLSGSAQVALLTSRNPQRTVPTVPSLYSRYMARPREGRASGLARWTRCQPRSQTAEPHGVLWHSAVAAASSGLVL